MTERPRGRSVVGWREWVALPALLPDDPVKAKLDTGARTSAIHAWDLDPFTRGDQPWIRFSLHPRQDDDLHVVHAEAELVAERAIRSSNGELELRAVILTEVELGGQRYAVELSLTNRDEMGFRMLIGRRAMAGHLLVDPGRSWLLGGNRHRPPPPASRGDSVADRPAHSEESQ